MSVSPRVLNALLFVMFLLMVSYLYLFGTPDLANFGKVALVILSLGIVLYYLLPKRDLASTHSISAYKNTITEQVRACGLHADTHEQYRSCLQTTMDR